MFQSVIETQRMRAGRFGTGAVISFAVHAGLVLGVLWLTAAPKVVDPPELHIGPIVRPQPPRGVVTASAGAQARTAPAKPRVRPNVLAKSVKPRPSEAVKPELPNPPGPIGQEGPSGPEGHPEGVETGGIAGVPFVPGSVFGPPTGEEEVPMGAGMTPPRLLSGPELRYTPEALAARVEGTLVVKCVITREGDAERCRVLKGLPHLSESVRASLEQRRYTPVTFQGRPVSVSYTFHVRLQLPR